MKSRVAPEPNTRYLTDIYLTDTFLNMPNPAPQFLLRYRESDSANGVTRATAKRIAQALGVDETQVIHLALRDLAARTLPQYEADDGMVSIRTIRRVQKAAGPAPKGAPASTLFPDLE
jgi:transcriptional regulator with XRE-family HTH domain